MLPCVADVVFGENVAGPDLFFDEISDAFHGSKRNIIAKQQAIIKKMEQECNENEAQRKNLQETVDFLEETLRRIEESKKKK